MFIVIFVITTIIASCLAIYFAINGSKEIKVLEDKINSFNSKNDISSNIEKDNIQNTNTSNNYEDVRPSEKIDTSDIIDISKNLNNDMYLSKRFDNVKTKISNGKAYVAFTTDEIGTSKYGKELNKYYEMLNVNSKVIDISILKIPTSGYPIFVMLMEDGTLQKTKFVEGSDIICNGKIEDYENITRIDDVEIINKLDFGGEIAESYSKSVVATDKYGNTKLIKNLY